MLHKKLILILIAIGTLGLAIPQNAQAAAFIDAVQIENSDQNNIHQVMHFKKKFHRGGFVVKKKFHGHRYHHRKFSRHHYHGKKFAHRGYHGKKYYKKYY